MQNFVTIRSDVLKKMTFEVFILGNFPDIPELKLYVCPGLWGIRCGIECMYI